MHGLLADHPPTDARPNKEDVNRVYGCGNTGTTYLNDNLTRKQCRHMNLGNARIAKGSSTKSSNKSLIELQLFFNDL